MIYKPQEGFFMITLKAPRCDVKHLNTEIIFFLSKALHNPLGRELAVSYSPLSLSFSLCPPPRAHGFQLLVVIPLLGMIVGENDDRNI